MSTVPVTVQQHCRTCPYPRWFKTGLSESFPECDAVLLAGPLRGSVVNQIMHLWDVPGITKGAARKSAAKSRQCEPKLSKDRFQHLPETCSSVSNLYRLIEIFSFFPFLLLTLGFDSVAVPLWHFICFFLLFFVLLKTLCTNRILVRLLLFSTSFF